MKEVGGRNLKEFFFAETEFIVTPLPARPYHYPAAFLRDLTAGIRNFLFRVKFRRLGQFTVC